MITDNFEEEEITGINITPLVDVMLALLIIFMVTTSYIVHRSIVVNLPKATTGENVITTKNLAFVLDKNSILYLDGKKIAYDNISSHIQSVKINLDNNQKLQALITADKETPHGEVISLIDIIRQNGISSFAINVESTSNTKKD